MIDLSIFFAHPTQCKSTYKTRGEGGLASSFFSSAFSSFFSSAFSSFFSSVLVAAVACSSYPMKFNNICHSLREQITKIGIDTLHRRKENNLATCLASSPIALVRSLKTGKEMTEGEARRRERIVF